MRGGGTGRKRSRKAESSRKPRGHRGSANIRCGGFKKCLPAGYPEAGFPEANMRINYEPCSNSRTEGRTGVRWKLAALITVEPGSNFSSLSFRRSCFPCPCFSDLHLRPLPLSSQTRFSSPLFFFFIPHSRLCLTSVAEFFRSTAIITPRRWKRKTVTENSWCKRGW